MEELTIEEMTNSELLVEKTKLEHEYEATKNTIIRLTERLSELDRKYVQIENERNKRLGL